MSLWLDPPDDDNNSSLTPQPTSVLGRTKVNHWLNPWGLPYLHTKTDSCIVSQLAIPQWPGIAFPPPKDPRIEIKFNCSWMDLAKLFCPLFMEMSIKAQRIYRFVNQPAIHPPGYLHHPHPSSSISPPTPHKKLYPMEKTFAQLLPFCSPTTFSPSSFAPPWLGNLLNNNNNSHSFFSAHSIDSSYILSLLHCHIFLFLWPTTTTNSSHGNLFCRRS